MVIIRSVNEIILSLIDFFQLAQPDLDTKPGTVARDLFIDSPATALSLLYDQMSSVSQQQSLRLVVGTDLDNLAKNFGIVRRQATPATGVALMTFSSLNANIAINVGDTVTAQNGFAYTVANGITVSTSAANFYRSVAAKFSDQLAFVGITDQYAVEVTVTATTAGSAGNIGSYSLNAVSTVGISNVTNINPFNGGTDQENDAAFRNRVLASFSGSSVDIASGNVPSQPVDSILTVTGSESGGNFAPYSVDSYGRVSGNYQLIKDTGAYAGSPWGFDTFHWISNQITNFSEALIRGQYDGQDPVTFTEVTLIPQVQQLVSITNENSTVTSNNSIIQLLHTPVTSVTRVYNVATGERYVVTNQNPSNTGTFNTTGQIQISGNTLPSPSDGLQVDYSWVVNYDPYSDYDGLYNVNNPRTVNDSVDWGLGNVIQNEEVSFSITPGTNFFQGLTSHPIDSVLTAKTFLEVDGYVSTVTSGVYVNRLQVVITNLATPTISVDSVRLKNNTAEVYNTAQSNGNIINTTIVVGIQLLNQTTIILPTDTTAQAGQIVTVIANSTDVFLAGNGQSSSTGNLITIPLAQITTAATTLNLRVTYIASVSTMFSSPVTTLPASHVGNGYLLNNNLGFNNFSVTNVSRRENQTVQLNLSNQYFVEINLPGTDFALSASQIISVVRLSDGLELWNSTNPGTIAVGTDGNYQLLFSGFNTPTAGNKVLVIYYATDIRRFQPFSYSNAIIKSRTDKLGKNSANGDFTLALNQFTNQSSSLVFQVVEPNSNIVLFSVTDGYLFSNGATATISSASVNFDTLADLTNKKVKISGSTLVGVNNNNNNGIYDILSYNQQTNEMVITEVLNNITADQISVIHISDGQEVWNYSGTIDVTNNQILMPPNVNFNVGDFVYVIFYDYDVLRQGPTRLSCSLSDQVANIGTMTVSGTTLNLVQDAIFTVTTSGLKLNLSQALRSALGLASSAVLPNTIALAKILKVEKVITASPTDNTVLEVTVTYDVDNTTIQNNLLYPGQMLGNPSLQNLDFVLPSTSTNTSNVAGAIYIPTLGDQIRVSFYYANTNVQENLAYTQNGTLYTNSRWAFINRIYPSGGFGASQSTKFTTTSFTQPALGSRYNVFYNYTAPQQNERIVITYNYNQLVATTTFNVESSRPITADVLVKEASLVELDLTMNVVIDSLYTNTSTTVLQNLRNAIQAAMTATALGQTIDQVTLINVAQGVTVDISDINVTFTAPLTPNLVPANVSIVADTPNVPNATVVSVSVNGPVLKISCQPLTPLASYYLVFQSTPDNPFQSLNGEAIIMANGVSNQYLISAPIGPDNPIYNYLINYFSGNIYEGLQDPNSVVTQYINSLATNLARALYDIRQLKTDNYLELDVIDEQKVRGGSPFDRLNNEGAYEVDRVATGPTDAVAAGTISFADFPYYAVTLQRELANDTLTASSVDSSGIFNINSLTLNLANAPVTRVNSIVFTLSTANPVYTYNISDLGYQIQNSRYDQDYGFTYPPLAANQIRLNDLILSDPLFSLDNILQVSVGYEYKDEGIVVDATTVKVTTVNQSIREVLPPIINVFSLQNAPITDNTGVLATFGGVTFTDPNQATPGALHPAFLQEIPFRLQALPSVPGTYAIDYSVGQVYVYGANLTNDGTGPEPPLATYYYLFTYIAEQDYAYDPTSYDLIALGQEI
ncbi:unnamed protein product [Sphagnum balticum]